ncbi:cysteine--tRNA ligase [Xaviernesmea oryzae]|uniref:Cysteine--tRNA ligase n=1 Tax=Xaviernesmea oryzae TaxID=464029 RepID=A0A1Q9AT67_9HYPH|nr:cysteine--tRNA ligase [Xaviernesmea oryzae]OLP58576.1 cysteine--tRNA ligase [Xaviernesmea oryzae]SEK62672.1 cysteinyl-tRNA synthetase [Xaviernesmea oryzae]
MAGTPTLRLYNTLTREKAPFAPIDACDVRMYVCGPTVYDFAHIGNARPVIVFDVLFRLLRHLYGADHVTYARNITDVDDKINARALRDHPDLPLNEAIRAVTEKTAMRFAADTAALGALAPTHEPRATDNIAEMIAIIQALIARGHAYSAGGEVLFDTASMPTYGQLSRRPLDEQQAGARVAVDAHKKNPADFVLWKLSSHNEPGWESPWGRGRPGWHIECSAMSSRYLGEVFDIHGGGLDLIFPHHENEIAQSCCAFGTQVMANVWMHNGFVQVEGRKMSKSEGNFITIADLLDTETFGAKHWAGDVLRLAMLMTHYRQPIDFTVKRLEEAQGLVRRWADAKLAILAAHPEVAGAAFTLPEDSPVLDDLNLYPALMGLNTLSGQALKGDGEAASTFLGLLDLLGFETIERNAQAAADLDLALSGEGEWADVAEKIETRRQLLIAKNFAEADRIRDELSARGIQLKDGKDPQTGERVTTWEVKR